MKLPSHTNISSISAGSTHSAFLDVNGKVYVTGSNHFGQLGLGEIDERELIHQIPVLVK